MSILATLLWAYVVSRRLKEGRPYQYRSTKSTDFWKKIMGVHTIDIRRYGSDSPCQMTSSLVFPIEEAQDHEENKGKRSQSGTDNGTGW